MEREREIEIGRRDTGHELARRADDDERMEIRVPREKRGDGVRQEPRCDRLGRADPERPANVHLLVLENGANRLDAIEHGRAFREELLAGRRQREAPARSLDETAPEILLE